MRKDGANNLVTQCLEILRSTYDSAVDFQESLKIAKFSKERIFVSSVVALIRGNLFACNSLKEAAQSFLEIMNGFLLYINCFNERS